MPARALFPLLLSLLVFLSGPLMVRGQESPPADPAEESAAARGGGDEIEQLLTTAAPEEETWHITGASLTGSVGGPQQIDSLEVTHGWRQRQR